MSPSDLDVNTAKISNVDHVQNLKMDFQNFIFQGLGSNSWGKKIKK